MHISTLRADCGLSLRPQTKLVNLKKADANHSRFSSSRLAWCCDLKAAFICCDGRVFDGYAGLTDPWVEFICQSPSGYQGDATGDKDA
jgi:hypothetical protein